MNRILKKILSERALLGVIAAILVFFLSRWLIEGAYFRKDIVFVYAPLENLYRALQHSGESLLWAPEFAGGYPLLATGQLGFVYPLHFILRYFLPAVWVLNLSLLFHAWLGGIGTFYYLKYNKLQNVAAAVGAVLFPLGAVMVGKYESMNLILPFMWVPLLLWLLQLFIETKRLHYLLLWIGANSLSILVGHVQIAVFVLILEGIFVVCLTGFAWRRWLSALATLGGVALIVGLTSFYWLPVLDIVPDTDRASGTLKPNEQGMFDNQFSPEAFWGLILPHPFGHHDTYHGPPAENELSNYYGPVALLAAVIGLFTIRRTFRIWWVPLVFIVVGLSLATGGYSPLFTFLVDHGWTYFNFPSRFFFYTHVGLVFLIAAGVQALMPFMKWRWVQGVVVVALVLPAVWVSWGWHEGVPWKFTQTPAVVPLLKQEPGIVRVLAGAQLPGLVLDEFFGMRAWNALCHKCRYRQTFVAPFANMSGIAFKVHRLSDSEGTITLRLYTSAGQFLREAHRSHTDLFDAERDMTAAGWNEFRFEPLTNAVGEEFYFELTSTVETVQAPRIWIHANPGEQYDPTGRLYDCTSGECRPVKESDLAFKVLVDSEGVIYYDALAPNAAVGFGLGSMQWNGALPILKVKEFLTPFDTWGDEFRGGARTMMNRFGMTHLIGVFPPHRYMTDEAFTWLADVPQGEVFLRLYRNDQVWPRVHFAERVRSVGSSIDQVNILLKTDPREQVTVLADVTSDLEFAVTDAQATLVRNERTEVAIQTEQGSDGFLVLRDVLLKGWEATVDDQPVVIHRVDGIFRGVFVPAGDHTVRFVYKPAWIQKAFYIESISLAVLLLLLLFDWFRRRYPVKL